jgi:GTPase SAR1 family protein
MLKISRQSLSSNRRLKILVLGASSSGKTALLERLTSGKFTESRHVQTLGAELTLKEETFKK